MTLFRSNPRAKQRWTLLAALAVAFILPWPPSPSPFTTIPIACSSSTGTAHRDQPALRAEDWRASVPPAHARSWRVSFLCRRRCRLHRRHHRRLVELPDRARRRRPSSPAAARRTSTASGRWLRKNGSVPDKDNLASRLHRSGRGPSLLRGGPRRHQGTATFGVWFLQGGVAPSPGVGGTFSGEHADGDLQRPRRLPGERRDSAGVVRHGWPRRGRLAAVPRRRRVPWRIGSAHPATGRAQQRVLRDGQPREQNSPWAFQASRSGAGSGRPVSSSRAASTWRVSASTDKCFSGVLLETRASNAAHGSLKDLVTGQLEPCGSSVVTTPSAGKQEVRLDWHGLGDRLRPAEHHRYRSQTFVRRDRRFLHCAVRPPLSDSRLHALWAGLGARRSLLAETVTGTGGTAQVVSDNVGPSTIGQERYCWRADYSGDQGPGGTGVPGSSDSSVDECFSVTPVDPTIDTVAGANVVLGNTGQRHGDARRDRRTSPAIRSSGVPSALRRTARSPSPS